MLSLKILKKFLQDSYVIVLRTFKWTYLRKYCEYPHRAGILETSYKILKILRSLCEYSQNFLGIILSMIY
jgi:hypothetical protein